MQLLLIENDRRSSNNHGFFLVDYGSWSNHILHWEDKIGALSDTPVSLVTYEAMHKVGKYRTSTCHTVLRMVILVL